MQVDPMTPVLTTPGSVLLKLRCDGPLSNFAFKVNSRRYIKVSPTMQGEVANALHVSWMKAGPQPTNRATTVPPP